MQPLIVALYCKHRSWKSSLLLCITYYSLALTYERAQQRFAQEGAERIGVCQLHRGIIAGRLCDGLEEERLLVLRWSQPATKIWYLRDYFIDEKHIYLALKHVVVWSLCYDSKQDFWWTPVVLLLIHNKTPINPKVYKKLKPFSVWRPFGLRLLPFWWLSCSKVFLIAILP